MIWSLRDRRKDDAGAASSDPHPFWLPNLRKSQKAEICGVVQCVTNVYALYVRLSRIVTAIFSGGHWRKFGQVTVC